jgi:cell wall-associated NlpC family hydrolase
MKNTTTRFKKFSLIAGAVALFAAVAIPTPAQAQTDQPMDLNRYCVAKSFTKARMLRPINGPQAANANWVCQKGIRLSVIRMDDVCRTQAGIGFTALALDANNAYSWVCRSTSQPPVVSPPAVVTPPVLNPPLVAVTPPLVVPVLVTPPVVTPPPVVVNPPVVATPSPVTFPLAYNLVNVRRTPSSTAAFVRTIPSGSVSVQCQTTGESVAFGRAPSTIWDQIGTDEWVSDVFVLTGVDGFHPSVARCGGAVPTPGVTPPATDVYAHYGVSQARAEAAVQNAIAEKNSFDPTWSDRYNRPWSGFCEGFAKWTYMQKGAYPWSAGSASEHYRNQLNAGRIRTDGTPPRGAMVFYGGSGGYGHVGIAIGDGTVISTSGFEGERKAIAQHVTNAFGSANPYLGWAMPRL